MTLPPPKCPRPEYPRPNFVRRDWRNLNGRWSFAFDFEEAGRERGWQQSRGFDETITVPFCPESALSGVGHTGFIPALWYHRRLEVPAAWAGQRLLLHFGGVDYRTEVFIDGRFAGGHVGGSSSWWLDVTSLLTPGRVHDLVVHARDDVRNRRQPAGKQSRELASHGCYYTRVTGIWQTVWLEPVPAGGLEQIRIVPDVAGGRFVIEPRYLSLNRSRRLRGTLFDALPAEGGAPADGGTPITQAELAVAQGVPLVLEVPDPRLWHPGDPHLYGLRLEVLEPSGEAHDTVDSYAGLREIRVEGDRILLNSEPLYQRLVLHQGYHPDGIWTAPSDAALARDIELAQAAGFNGARLHQKAFEPRFHWHADRLGFLTWGEMASWGLDENDPAAARNFLAEWREVVERDRNHPSIIAWTPLNETEFEIVSEEHRRLVTDAYQLTRSLDPTRPVNDASGWVHQRTDLWTVHLYTQDPDELRRQLQGAEPLRNQPAHEPPYGGQPYLVDEFGGTRWSAHDVTANAWGYGNDPSSLEEFYARLQGLVDALLASPRVAGWCYTQLTDVEQEQNGLYTYHREPKFDMERIRAIFERLPLREQVG